MSKVINLINVVDSDDFMIAIVVGCFFGDIITIYFIYDLLKASF